MVTDADTVFEEQASEFLKQFILKAHEFEFPGMMDPTEVKILALEMELEKVFGPKIHEIFEVDYEVDDDHFILICVDPLLARKVMKNYLPIGSA